ncbi:hypothetical protein ACF0H5_002405 [Mactra antiquata]
MSNPRDGKMSSSLQTYIERLELQAKPNSNDERHVLYTKLFNAYGKYFGGDEAHSVGSTSEGLKLRSRHDGGDADFLVCSGRLRIPIASLEPREATPCYMRVKGDMLPAAFREHLVDGYLSADLVRQVNPKLFTTFRAIFTIVTTPSDGIPGRHSRVTTIGLPMKVGTARKEFRNLVIEGVDTPDFRSQRSRLTLARRSHVAAQLRSRRSEVRMNASDFMIIRRILNAFIDLEVPGSAGSMFGQLNKFASLLRSVFERPSLEDNNDDGEERVEFNNDLDEEDANRSYKATYDEMTSKDFVPAVKIDGKLKCMVDWYDRVIKGRWPPRDLAEEIFNTDLFLVARDAPIDPNHALDFCLSFNKMEMTLCRRLTAVQRKVYLILKSYLNGILKKKHEELGIELKLKSYYLKTVLFWVCEQEDPSIWTLDVLSPLKKVLGFLQKCLAERHLSHYFVIKSNLFAEMKDLDFDVLRECITEIKDDPVHSIEEFFNQDANSRAEVWLTEEEVRCIMEMRQDGGDQEAMDRLEDALIDIQRGFNESVRVENDKPPIKQAVLEVLDKFFEDERAKEVTSAANNMQLGGASNRNPNPSPLSLFSGLIGSYVTSGGQQSVNRERVGQVSDALQLLGQFSPEVSQHINILGGRRGIETVVAQQGRSKEEQRQQIRAVTERYLSCPDEEVGDVRMELKYIYAGYFLGRVE